MPLRETLVGRIVEPAAVDGSPGGVLLVLGALVATYPVKKLVDPKFGANDPDVQVKIQQLAAACR